jgi:FemAB family protein
MKGKGENQQDTLATVQKIFAVVGLSATFRTSDSRDWAVATAALAYTPVAYSLHSLEYQQAYHSQLGGLWTDLSIALRHDGKAIGIWPLTLSEFGGTASVSSQGLPILPPLFASGTPAKIQKRLISKMLSALEELCVVHNINHWTSHVPFDGTSAAMVGEWHHQIMANGGRGQLLCDLYVDLSLDIEDIRKHFRKSYKPLISLGLRTWTVQIVSNSDKAAWHAFKELHKKAAGRITRSDDTWALQLAAIEVGDAFMVALRDHSGDMVGAGFFAITRHEASYSVGAYNRDLFDKPLGHVVQQAAIEEMKRRGLRWYHIGRRPYPNETPGPSPKELSIGEFKQGFATNFMPRYLLQHDRKYRGARRTE